MNKIAPILAILFVVTGGALYLNHVQNVSAANTVHIHWVVAHEPASLFDRAQQTFVSVFNANSDGIKIDVQSLTPSDFGKNSGRIETSEVLQMLDSKKVQMASVVTASMRSADPLLGVVTLPYLFKNYDTAQPVLEGPIGQQILATVAASSTVRALAFTFSGGFEVIQTTSKKIQTPADIKGLRIGTPNGPVSQAILAAMGATPVALDPQLNNADLQKELADGKIDGLEYTYTRLAFATSSLQKSTINETFHSLYLTSIIVSDSFFDSLSPKNQAALQKAAFEAARVERADSITLGAKTKTDLAANGDTIVTPTAEGVTAFTSKTASVYNTYVPVFGKDLIQSIIDAQK